MSKKLLSAVMVIMIAGFAVYSGDTPPDGADIKENAYTGKLEAVWGLKTRPSSRTPVELDYDIYHSVLENGEWNGTGTITRNGKDDVNPAIAFDPRGNRVVVWQGKRSVWSIFLSYQGVSDKIWSPPLQVSPRGVDCINPDIECEDGKCYISYEEKDTGDRTTVILIGIDYDHFGGLGGHRIVVPGIDPGTSSLRFVVNNPGDSNPALHGKSGHIWVVWEDGEYLMYSEDSDLNFTWQDPPKRKFMGDPAGRNEVEKEIEQEILGGN